MNLQIDLNPREVYGNWRAGYALDIHTLSSRRLPDGTYDTKRPEIGEMVYRVKNKSDRSKIQPLAEIAAEFIKDRFVVNQHFILPYLDAIIPTPPSDTSRAFQPVSEIAARIGQILDVPVTFDYLIKVRETTPAKNLEAGESRREQLHGAFIVKATPEKYRCVLLFDDIYRSGETLTEITDVLHKQGGISRVFVLTLTQTRTKK